MNDILEPGDLVRNPDKPEWGIGQVQSNIGKRITVNFEHLGKIVIMNDTVKLVIVSDTGSTRT